MKKSVTTSIGQRNRHEISKFSLPTKTFKFNSGRSVKAVLQNIPFDQIEEKTRVHPLNNRIQSSLNEISVRDILPSIMSSSIIDEAFGIVARDGIIEIVDGTRRRFCAILAKKDYPVYAVADGELINDHEIMGYMLDKQKSKSFSYRERGFNLIYLQKKHNFETKEEISKYLGFGRETYRKIVVASNIDQMLISVFPDPETIPNTFYARLARIEKKLKKGEIEIKSFVDNLEPVDLSDISDDLTTVHESIISNMEGYFSKPKKAKGWEQEFVSKSGVKKVSVERTMDKKKFRVTLNNLGIEEQKILEDFVRGKYKKLN